MSNATVLESSEPQKYSSKYYSRFHPQKSRTIQAMREGAEIEFDRDVRTRHPRPSFCCRSARSGRAKSTATAQQHITIFSTTACSCYSGGSWNVRSWRKIDAVDLVLSVKYLAGLLIPPIFLLLLGLTPLYFSRHPEVDGFVPAISLAYST